MVKEPKKLARYATPKHFTAIYSHCDVAIRPKSEVYSPGDWWRGLLMAAYMTGWRISELISLRWDDVSLDDATAITRWADNKAKRDERVPLHPIVVEHVRKLIDLGAILVFWWPHDRRTLWEDFHKIQTAAGIDLPCREKHQHNENCHVYGFHDLRRAFATANATRLSSSSLQAMMRHKSYATTQRYVNTAKQLDEAVGKLFVPDVRTKVKDEASDE